MKILKNIIAIAVLLFSVIIYSQEVVPETYINPLDIDYTYMVYNSSRNISYRSGADPAVIEFRGEYYMFVTRSFGYWHSPNLINFIPMTQKKGSGHLPRLLPKTFKIRSCLLTTTGKLICIGARLTNIHFV